MTEKKKSNFNIWICLLLLVLFFPLAILYAIITLLQDNNEIVRRKK
jgi:hypothetical protein